MKEKSNTFPYPEGRDISVTMPVLPDLAKRFATLSEMQKPNNAHSVVGSFVAT